MSQPTAFLVMYLDVTASDGPKIASISLYSEEKPTTNLRQYRQFTVATGRGFDYSEGIDHIREQMRESRGYLNWCIPFMAQSTREVLGIAV